MAKEYKRLLYYPLLDNIRKLQKGEISVEESLLEDSARIPLCNPCHERTIHLFKYVARVSFEIAEEEFIVNQKVSNYYVSIPVETPDENIEKFFKKYPQYLPYRVEGKEGRE